MYYLLELFKTENKRLLDEPVRTQTVTIHQVGGAIVRMLASGEGDVVVVSEIDEQTFVYFYQEKGKKDGSHKPRG